MPSQFTFQGEIEVSLRTVGKSIELVVRDTGTGIPKEEIPHVFERFYRVENARGRSLEGSGIGLALVQELAKLHGGSVRAESKLNCGSQFIVDIPLGKDHCRRTALRLHELSRPQVYAPRRMYKNRCTGRRVRRTSRMMYKLHH